MFAHPIELTIGQLVMIIVAMIVGAYFVIYMYSPGNGDAIKSSEASQRVRQIVPGSSCALFDGNQAGCQEEMGCMYHDTCGLCENEGVPPEEVCPLCAQWDTDPQTCNTQPECEYYEECRLCDQKGLTEDILCSGCAQFDGDPVACESYAGCAYYPQCDLCDDATLGAEMVCGVQQL